jgi:hypothetical protein
MMLDWAAMGKKPAMKTPSAVTLPFNKFWTWLQAHANCILRAGTPEVLLFDHEEYHWHLAAEDEMTLLVQLVRGKELIGEILILPADIAYVDSIVGESEEVTFELIAETETTREAIYHFVMAHGYDEADQPTARRWTH